MRPNSLLEICLGFFGATAALGFFYFMLYHWMIGGIILVAALLLVYYFMPEDKVQAEEDKGLDIPIIYGDS